ncbi:MAG: DUF5824 family protein, partial [Pseudomonadota bacterium]
METYYSFWGWIKPDGSLLLPTIKQKTDPRREFIHDDILPKGLFPRSAFGKGWYRFFIELYSPKLLHIHRPSYITDDINYETVVNGVRNIEKAIISEKHKEVFPKVMLPERIALYINNTPTSATQSNLYATLKKLDTINETVNSTGLKKYKEFVESLTISENLGNPYPYKELISGSYRENVYLFLTNDTPEQIAYLVHINNYIMNATAGVSFTKHMNLRPEYSDKSISIDNFDTVTDVYEYFSGETYKIDKVDNIAASRRIFSTIIDILNDFNNQYQPDKMIFTADKDEPSRVKLYDFLTSILKKQYNYDVTTTDKDQVFGYTLDYMKYALSKKRTEGSMNENSSRRVGKRMGHDIYVHKNYTDLAGIPEDILSVAKEHLPQDFKYQIVKYNKQTNSLSFIQSPDFDSADEPIVGNAIKVSADGKTSITKQKTDPQIYHHKWEMVPDNYPGFDVNKSKKRSQNWRSVIGVNREVSSRIGTKSYWDREVVPRIPQIEESKDDIEHQPGSETTQVEATTSSYIKAAKLLLPLLQPDARVLDYGAGLGAGTNAMRSILTDVAQVDSYEPEPKRSKYKPTFTKTSEIIDGYDAVVCLNVLNVMTPNIRDAVVRNIGELLKPGGMAIIGVRAFRGDVNKIKNYEPGDEPGSVWVLRSGNRIYQKGFDGNELREYIGDILGTEFDIKKIPNLTGNAVMATKNDVDEITEETKKSVTALKKKAKASGVPYSILKQVYNRGMAAWVTGHRPGATQSAWAFARVNSFLTKGKTWYSADADLAKKARKYLTERRSTQKRPESEITEDLGNSYEFKIYGAYDRSLIRYVFLVKDTEPKKFAYMVLFTKISSTVLFKQFEMSYDFELDDINDLNDFYANKVETETSTLSISDVGNLSASRKIISTIINIISDYVNRYDPNKLYFTADKSEPSRIRLYDFLTNMLMKKYDYDLTIDKAMTGSVLYTLSKEEITEPGEYVYHASYLPDLARGLRSILSKGLVPSKEGYGGSGIYFAYEPEGGLYHVSKEDATIFRAKWSDLVSKFGTYPDNPNGIQRDNDEIIVPRAVPANMLEIEYFPDEWWKVEDVYDSETRSIDESHMFNYTDWGWITPEGISIKPMESDKTHTSILRRLGEKSKYGLSETETEFSVIRKGWIRWSLHENALRFNTKNWNGSLSVQKTITDIVNKYLNVEEYSFEWD